MSPRVGWRRCRAIWRASRPARRGGGRRVLAGEPAAAAPVAADQPGRLYQPGDALAACPHPVVVAQLGVDARSTIGAARGPVELADLLQQLLVGPCPRGGTSLEPGVEATTRDVQDPAQQADRVVSLLRRDEPIPAHRVVSFAKKAAAFFSISRSWRSTWFSRRRRRSSCCSAVVSSPGRPWPASTSAWRTPLRRVWPETPRSLASSGIVLPLVRASSTASARNAAG